MLRSLTTMMLKTASTRLADAKPIVWRTLNVQASRGTLYLPSVAINQTPTNRTQCYSTRVTAAQVFAKEEAEIGEIEWNAQLANAVSLMGYISDDIKVKPAGNSRVATCQLCVSHAKGKYSWFDVDIWGDLADVAASELKKDERIQVVGKLRVDTWEWQGAKQKKAKVVASAICRVLDTREGQGFASNGFSQEPAASPGLDDQTAGLPGWDSETPPNLQQASNEEKWDHLVKHYSEYYDNRLTKRNPKGPDFKHKSTGSALWLSSAPEWAAEQLNKIAAPRQ